jgi:hypothetical protein
MMLDSLEPGRHTVGLTAIDSDGQLASHAIDIRVYGAAITYLPMLTVSR